MSLKIHNCSNNSTIFNTKSWVEYDEKVAVALLLFELWSKAGLENGRMRVKTIVTGNDLTEGLGFYGETDCDKETIERLKQLSEVLNDVAYDLANLRRQVEGRHEGSAKAIKMQLDFMRDELLWIIFDEEMASDIAELLWEEE